jgi:hypothetical protein
MLAFIQSLTAFGVTTCFWNWPDAFGVYPQDTLDPRPPLAS